MVGNQEASAGLDRQSQESRRQTAKVEVEFQKAKAELAHLSELAADTQERLEQTRVELAAEKKAKQALKEQHEEDVSALEEKVKQEREKRGKLAKTRAQKNGELLEKF